MDNMTMLFSPEHSLKIAAKAVGDHAESTDMAVGIITGIAAAIEEWNRLTAGEQTLAAERPTEVLRDTDKESTPAIPRPRSVAASAGK